MDGIDAIAGDDEVGAGAGGDVSTTGACESDRCWHVIWNREVEVVVRIQRDVDRGGRRGEHEGVARPRPGAGRDCRIQGDETIITGGIDEHEAAAAMIDELDACERIAAAGSAAIDRQAAGTVESEVRKRERGGVDGGVVAAAAGDRIVAAAARELVGAGIAGEGVAGAAPDDVLDVANEPVRPAPAMPVAVWAPRSTLTALAVPV